MRLYINIDHVATVRQARKTDEPDPVRCAVLAELGGADGITVHLREDRRHIQDRDVHLLMETVRTGVNLELAASSEILDLACELRPLQATLVPEKREEVTTEGGLDFGPQENREALAEALARLNAQGIRTSLFIDPDLPALEYSKELGAQAVELHTGEYANARGDHRGRELGRLAKMAREGRAMGLAVHAGHGLTYENVIPVAAIPEIEELNIGHSIISRAVFTGLERAVREMGKLIYRAPRMVEEAGAWFPPSAFERAGFVKKDWRVVLGFSVTAVLLWWVLRHVPLGEVWHEIQGADFWLLGLAVAIGYTNYLFRSIRWGILLHPICSETSLRSRFAAMNIGFMATNLIPLRVGEFVRPYALSRMEPVSVSGAFGSLVVERFLDSFTIAALLFVAISAPGFPENPVVWGASLGVWIRWFLVALGVLLSFMVLLLLFPRPLVKTVEGLARFLPKKIGSLVVDVLEAFLDGLRVLHSPVLLFKAIAWSVWIWVFQSLSFWVAFMAFGINVGFSVALFVNGTVALAVAAPAAPGFLGTFQMGVIGGLGVYGVSEAAAVALSFGFWGGGFIPVTLIGLYYAGKLGLSIGEVGKSGARVEEAVERAHPESSGSTSSQESAG